MSLQAKVISIILCVIPMAYLALGRLVPCGHIALWCQLGGLFGWLLLPYSFLAASLYPRSEMMFVFLGLIQFPGYVVLWYLLRRLTRHGFVLAIVMAGMHPVIAVACFMLTIKFTG